MKHLLIILTLGLPVAAHAEYVIVLGSFEHRAIAIEQLQVKRHIPDKEERLLILVMQKKQKPNGFRLVAGPYSTFKSAKARLDAWRTVSKDAWILKRKLPSRIEQEIPLET